MTMLEFVSASTPWIFALRDRYDWRRLSLWSGASRIRNAAALVALGVLFALPTWAHHQHRHRPEPRREWPQGHDTRAFGGYVELESGVAAIPDAVVHGPFVDGDLDLHPGFVTGGAVGAQLTPFLRLEGAMNYREAQVDNFFVEGFVSDGDGSFGAFSTFANAYVDLAIPGVPVTPFIGGGLGVAVVTLDTYDPFERVYIDDESVQFAWNLSAGASWALGERIDLVTRYRYFATEDTDEDYKDGTLRFGEADVEMDSHEAVLGVRFRF
jgi:opacity protein-like surface antigen